VLILTAIVVGIAVTALGLAISIRIKEEYGTIEEAETREMDRQA
jgi:multicomponent Na+:H+ antiporter subunit C